MNKKLLYINKGGNNVNSLCLVQKEAGRKRTFRRQERDSQHL